MNLTRKQQAIVNLIADGMTSKQIAAALHMSITAVEHHISRVRKMAGVQDRSDLAQFATLTDLAKREIQVVTLVAQGLKNHEIAARMGVKVLTIAGYVSTISYKIDCHSREELAKWAVSKGLISEQDSILGKGQPQEIQHTPGEMQRLSRIEREKRLYDEVAARLGFYQRRNDL